MRVQKKQTDNFNKADLYEKLVNTSGDCMLVVDEKGLISFAAPQTKKLFGWESEEVIGKPVEILIPESFTEKHIALRQSYQKNPHPRPMGISLNLYAKRKNNTKFPVDIKLNFFKSKDKTFYLAVIRDITEYKQLENEIMGFANILESSLNEIYIFDANTLLFINVNKGARKNLGYSYDELKRFTPLDIKPEFTIEVFEKLIKPLRTRKKDITTFETVHRRKDGSRYPVEVHLQLTTLSEKEVFIAIIIDITERKQAEEALLQYKNIVSSSSDLMAVLDKNFKFLTCNKAYFEAFGKTSEELIGFTAEDVFGKEIFETKIKPKALRSLSGEEVNYQEWFNFPVKGKCYIDATYYPYKNKHNEIKGFVVNARDITERKKIEDRYKILSNLTSDFAYSLSIQPDGSFLREWVTDAFESITGYSEKEIHEKEVLSSLILPEDKYILDAHIETVLRKEKSTVEFRIKKKDGSVIYVEDYRYPVINEKTGEVTHIIGAIKDVTDKLKALTEIRNNENKFRSLFENSFDGIVLSDNRVLIDCNKAAAEILNCSKDDIIGKSPLDFLPEYQPEAVSSEEKISETIQSVLKGKPKKIEWQAKTLDGKTKYIDTSFNRVCYNNRNIIQCIFRDVTKKKEKELELIKAKEKAEESNKVKSKFFANMSHELRTPLVGILGFSEIIKDEAENEELKEYGSMIYTSSLRLQRTLNSVLEFSKIDDRSFKLELENVNVNSLAQNEFKLFKIDAEKTGIDYKLNMFEDSLIIKSDNRLLATIFNHLIDNGVKFTKKGFVEVNINKIVLGKNPFLSFEVRDSGIGIEKEQLNLIWDEFKQVSEGLARNYEGVGLGLSIVKKFVGLLNGSIEVESEYGKGSSFRVKIPVEQVQKEDRKSDGIKVKSEEKLNKIILLVEDDELNAKTIKKFLDKKYYVDSAETPKEAILMCNNKKYYLVLMDINLKSDMNGIELMKFLKENNINYKNTPFIAQTAYAVNEDKMRFMESGFSDFISKPYTRNSLLEIVEKNLVEV